MLCHQRGKTSEKRYVPLSGRVGGHFDTQVCESGQQTLRQVEPQEHRLLFPQDQVREPRIQSQLVPPVGLDTNGAASSAGRRGQSSAGFCLHVKTETGGAYALTFSPKSAISDFVIRPNRQKMESKSTHLQRFGNL